MKRGVLVDFLRFVGYLLGFCFFLGLLNICKIKLLELVL